MSTKGMSWGIQTLEDVRVRCRVDPDTGCWVWGMSLASGVPCLRVPAGVLGNEKAVVMSAHKAAWLLAGNTRPGEGIALIRKVCCKESLCVAPHHRRVGSRSAVNRAAAARGSYNSHVRIEALLAGCLKQAISVEMVRAIEGRLAEGASARALAKEFGVDKDTVSKVRDGKHFHQRRTGAASVFTWRPVSAACRVAELEAA